MFNFQEFYPTPPELVDTLLHGVDVWKVKTVLEPSAGKGDIIERLNKIAENEGYSTRRYAPKFSVDAIEIDEGLRHVLHGRGMRVIHDDFLSFHSFQRWDLVIMNPPFSDGDKHLTHALNFVAPNGTLLCILNADTIRNPYSNSRKALCAKLKELNAEITFQQQAFSKAERRTDVEIAIIRLRMPEKTAHDSILVDEFIKAKEAEPPPVYDAKNPLVSSNQIRALVEMYNAESQLGIKTIMEYCGITRYMVNGEKENKSLLYLTTHNKKGENTRVDFQHPQDAINNYLTALRGKYWNQLFTAKEFTDKLTNNVSSELHSRVDEFAAYEFNMFNIYNLFLQVSKNICSGIEQTILELFDRLTSRHAYTNFSNLIHLYNGWKTNNCYKIGTKVIITLYGWEHDYINNLREMEKTFDYLSGKATSDHASLGEIYYKAKDSGKTKNIQFKHFTGSFYRKGTCHLVFHDPMLVEKFNIFAGQRKNWLPPGYGTTAYENMDSEAQAVVREFHGGNVKEYQKIVTYRGYYLVKSNDLMTLSTAV